MLSNIEPVNNEMLIMPYLRTGMCADMRMDMGADVRMDIGAHVRMDLGADMSQAHSTNRWTNTDRDFTHVLGRVFGRACVRALRALCACAHSCNACVVHCAEV